ncbi:YtoQ family protein [Mycobacteroides abscessus subsp. abscessus]|nr:YtoQ family protein [Mycobacteroides abscessus subsp. abscessus]
MEKSDLVIALFGEQYKQWNTSMDVKNCTTRLKNSHKKQTQQSKPLIRQSKFFHMSLKKTEMRKRLA